MKNLDRLFWFNKNTVAQYNLSDITFSKPPVILVLLLIVILIIYTL